MSEVFSRSKLGYELAGRLLKPSVLDENLRSGLFLAGLRRTGKTTFLRNDLVPQLRSRGAVVIYVDLWSDALSNPVTLVHTALKNVITELAIPLNHRTRINKNEDDGATLADTFTEIVKQTRRDVVLIIDEVLQAICSEAGNQMLLALKAARDAINPRTNTPGHFLLLGTGSHPSLINELTTRHQQAFAGATSLPYPVLNQHYVHYVLERLQIEGYTPLPSEGAAWEAFQALGHRPEEFLRALGQLRSSPDAKDANAATVLAADLELEKITDRMRDAAYDMELGKVEQLGKLATEIFTRVVAGDGNPQNLLSAAATFSAAIGREIRVEEIQQMVNELISINVLIRQDHGSYGITDPVVQEIWRERRGAG
jgi:hypothetical protein